MLSLFRQPVHRPLIPFGLFDWDDIEPAYYERSSVTQYENNDYVKIQLQKTGGDFKNYKINLEGAADGKKLLKITSENEKFEKVYEVDPAIIDVDNISWKWYKENNLLEVYIPKKKAQAQPEHGLAEEGKPAETPAAEAKPIEARSPSPDKVTKSSKKTKKDKAKEKHRKELARLRESLAQLEAEMAQLDDESDAEDSEAEAREV